MAGAGVVVAQGHNNQRQVTKASGKEGSRRLATKAVSNWWQAMTKLDRGKGYGGGGSSRVVEVKGSKLRC